MPTKLADIQPRLPGFSTDFEREGSSAIEEESEQTEPKAESMWQSSREESRRSELARPANHVNKLLWQRRTRPNLFDNVSANANDTDNVPEELSPAVTQAPVQSAASFQAFASGDKAKSREIIAAIRTVKEIEQSRRRPTVAEQITLGKFPGFGCVALSIFPDPVTGKFKDGWQEIGQELKDLLTPEEYASAKRSVYNAFYTSPTVIAEMNSALARLGVPATGLILEPGCGTGNFMAGATDKRFIGIELDGISGRIARARFPDADIRNEDFRQTKLPELDAVIGNPPFADIRIDYDGERLALHDFFIAKSLDALKPGGIAALVTTHFSLDKQNAAARELIAGKADFLGAIRLPSTAFKREGTSVVTDILFLRKRAPGETAHHADPDWLQTGTINVDSRDVVISRYFANHPEMVLGTFSGKDTLYGNEGYSVTPTGDLAGQLRAAIEQLPRFETNEAAKAEAVEPPRFVPQPPDKHVGEGSFFVGDDRVIRQIVDGKAEPVVYGGTTLRAGGTHLGKRLAALIGIRDKARRVLQSQNESWPESARKDARRDLNYAYDFFVSRYGPINKSTLSETADGGTIRRMPNLVKFRDDPDAMLVSSLEEYDESTGEAKKAAIMLKDVVGKAPPITTVASAEDGLLVSLDERGCVDMPFIAKLYGKPVDKVAEELGDLIFFDPTIKTWQTADAYLSENVRAKLKAAQAAGSDFVRNAEALAAVQPEDVLPGDIDANLGAPWIPVADVQEFAAELFRVPKSAMAIGHFEKDAVWTVEGNYEALQSVAATAEFGTPRINGVTLLDQALNQKSPVIYDIIHNGSSEQKVVNPEETLAAKEKQKAIKQKFKEWIFADPDRTERLVRLYNDTYNNLRPRLFDGSHLQFPGMSAAIALRQNQKDGIWRVMSGGNTLLAHAVGAGKTWIMAAAGMKMKQAGLIHKPMYVVPNHMLEQFSREFLQLYPNAKLLVAGKDDFTRERRKLLTAKIAANNWDGIIVTHSSFERIGMSREYQEKFLREQIAEYDRLLIDTALMKSDRTQRNLIKTIEKQKAAREARLKDLLAEDKKDDGLVFDELGVDHLFIDEAQAFKNLETPTKMERVAGIQTGGSERAFDVFMKARYLNEKHAGHGVTFATGTPVSNTMVELYTMQRFLDPKGLKDRNIEHFDAWAATFGEVVESMEIAPDGKSLRPRMRFAKFLNLPELQQMFRSYADVQTADMLDLPRPKLETGKPITIACPMSDEQAELQRELVARYERLRSQKVDPREDNALNITTDGRKLALDARMLSAAARDFPGSKINALADKVIETWQRSQPTLGTQMIFCDMGVNATRGFSAYEEVVAKLIERGIPAGQIAVMGDADSDAKKQALFERVRQGDVRVLLGSTGKMGTGTNVQRRLVALHHLDAPWKPAEVEQREGRILRQGNTNSEVAIYRYVTEGSFDAYMWQALETKAKFINQVMTGESAVRRAEDVGGQELSYAEVKAIASGNPAVLTLAEADAELKRLSILRKNHADEQYLARKNLRELPLTIERLKARLAGLQADAATAKTDATIIVNDRRCSHEEALAQLANALNRIPDRIDRPHRHVLGMFHALTFGIERSPLGAVELFLEGKAHRHDRLSRESHGPRAIMNALNRLLGGFDAEIHTTQRELNLAEKQLSEFQMRHGLPFAHAAYTDELNELRDRLKSALSCNGEPDKAEADSRELSIRIKVLMASQSISAEQAIRSKANRSERPVTARLKRPSPPSASPPVEPERAVIEQLRHDEACSQPQQPAGNENATPSFRQRLASEPQRRLRQASLF